MQEYLDNGCHLSWLINCKQHQVESYCPRQLPEVLDAPTSVSGEEVLPGFSLDLTAIWYRAITFMAKLGILF